MGNSSWNYVDWGCCACSVSGLVCITIQCLQMINKLISTPFAGEGVNCALYDSFQLAQQIVKYGLDALDRAISEYEKLMFPRAIHLVKKSAQNGEFWFAPDAPRGFLQAISGTNSAEASGFDET